MSKLRAAFAAFVLSMTAALHAAPASGGSVHTADVARVRQLLDDWRGDGAILGEAREILRQVLKDEPRNAPAWRELARFHIMDGYTSHSEVEGESLAAADQALKRAIEIDPGFADAYVLGGHLYWLMHRPAEARAALAKADQLGTNDPWLQLNWATLLLEDGRFEEAAKRYERVLATGTPNKKAYGSALEGLIRYHKSAGRLDEADKLYRRQIDHEPSSAWSYGNYSEFLLCYRDDYDGAIRQAGRALRLMDYGAARAALAAALSRKWAEQMTHGRTDEAEKIRASLGMDVDGQALEVYTSICPDGPGADPIANAVRLYDASRPAIQRR